MKQAILSLLVVGQLGLMGCATPQMAQTSAPTLTTTSLGINAAASTTAALPWANASTLQPVYMGFGKLSGSQAAFICTLVGLALITCPVWGPFYLLHDWFGHR